MHRATAQNQTTLFHVQNSKMESKWFWIKSYKNRSFTKTYVHRQFSGSQDLMVHQENAQSKKEKVFSQFKARANHNAVFGTETVATQ